MEHPVVRLSALVIAFLAIDPFQWSARGRSDSVANDIAPYDEVMRNWPWDINSRLAVAKLEFVDEVYGPESMEFDNRGRGPYCGLADGRIVRWIREKQEWETFALVTPNWSEKLCANGINSTTDKQWEYEPLCGRPLGLRFNKNSGELYIADAYYGLLVVGPEGGMATPLATHDVEGNRILFANDLDIHKNGSIYFTDSSTKYNRAKNLYIILERDATGRLLRYDPPTKETHVVLDGISFPNGVQLSKNQSFLFFTITTNCRLMKYWLEGEKNGTLEIVADLPGFPDNIRVNEKDEYWVAIDCCRTQAQEILLLHPWLVKIYFRLPQEQLVRIIGMQTFAVIALFDENGKILDVLESRRSSGIKQTSEVRQINDTLWIGSVVHNHIGTLYYPPI